MRDVNHNVTVGEVALSKDKMVILRETDMVRTAVEEVSKKRQGLACIIDTEDRLVGVFTDGDLRRVLLMDHKPIAAIFAEDIVNHMTETPKRIVPSTSLEDAVVYMESVDIYDLPVVDVEQKIIGLLHMHTALKHLLGL